MDDVKATVLSILQDLTGEDVSNNMDANLFDEGILDSMGFRTTVTGTSKSAWY
ncbi:MAG: hypothetical protein ACFWT9_13540 [Lactiplantibacillus plantarum]